MLRQVTTGVFAGLLVLAAITVRVQIAQAHDPKPVLRNIFKAPLAVITVYQVKAGMQEPFIDAMVSSGPYNRVLNGFANERILQALPKSKEEPAFFMSFARYYDKETAAFVDSERNQAISNYLVSTPVRVEAALVEHELADWGWEKGTAQAVLQVRPMEDQEIFKRSISSLSFFKSGYTGQVGMIEFVPPSTPLSEIRDQLAKRLGLSGASIFTTPSGLAVYSEYFKTPAAAAGQTLTSSATDISGAQAAVVVQNYVSR
jgi:hypothetical protein